MEALPQTLAEMARDALAEATVATVTSESAAEAAEVTVKVTADRYGRPILHVAPESPLVDSIAAGRVVTVTVAAAAPFEALSLRGPALRVKACDKDERRVMYRVALLGVSFVRPRRAPVRLAAFHAAQPDLLWGRGEQMLEHLSTNHAADLKACVCAHGMPDASAVVARSLDRRGIDLAVLTPEGVTAMWMPFMQGPVASPEELALQLRLCLTCRCRNHNEESR